MDTEYTRRSARRMTVAVVAVGLALGLTVNGVQAQELEITRHDLETAFTQPERQVAQLMGDRGVMQVALVDIADYVENEREVAKLREKHGEAIQKYQKALRKDQPTTQAVQRTLRDADLGIEDVLAVRVGDWTTPKEGVTGSERDEAAAHETVYVIVSGADQQMSRKPSR